MPPADKQERLHLKNGVPLTWVIGGFVTILFWGWNTSKEMATESAVLKGNIKTIEDKVIMLETKAKTNADNIQSIKDGQQTFAISLAELKTQQAYIIEGVKRIEAAVLTPAIPLQQKK